MSRLYMRTSDEAHVYMDQRPCACGDIEFARQSAVMTDGDVLCSRYFGECRTCGTMREFVFELPKAQRPIGNQVEFGGADPSRLLDPGEWMGISEYYAKLVPGTPDDLDIACAALEEVIKFLPDGEESVPADAFRTERGRAVRDREPGRFRRARLAAVLDVYRKLLAKQDLTQTAVAWKHTGDAEFPYTADVRGRRFTIRINDFPAEPLYTLLAEGNELQDLEDWPPAWVMPAPPKELLALLVPKSPACSICGSIRDVASANTGRDDHFGPPITSLKRNGIESDDDLWECPECAAVFLWHDSVAQTGSGNNDEEVLTRLPSPQASFVRSFLHRGERRAEEAAQDAGRLVELPRAARDLLLSHLLRRDRELAARLVPWMLDELSRGDDASLPWADAFVRSFASGEDAARVMSELSARPPSPALEKLRAHCKRALCSICRTIGTYPPTIARRDRPPAPLDSLVQLGASDEVDLWECPECDSMFMWESKDGNEGSLTRPSERLASAFRACVHRTGVVADSDIEVVFACAASKVVLAHGMRRDRELVRQLAPRIDPVESWDAFESALAKLTNDEAWSELEKEIRRALRLITGFAGARIGARAKADVEHDLWKRLGLLYSDRLDAQESALTALEMAAKLRADDDETQLALAALHEQAERFEQAIRCNEIAVRANPKRVDGYRNLFRIHTQQGAHDAAWCAASALAFLEHPGPEVDFYARHGSPAAPPFTGPLEETSWLLLRHEDESDVITNVFRVLAPAAARLAKAENRAGASALGRFEPRSGIGAGELAFMAGRSAAYGREPLRSLFSDHGAVSELEDLFMAGLRAVWLDAWRSPPVFGARAVERAAELARFLEPTELVALRTSVTPVRKQGLVDIVKWARGVELTAARAGLLFSGDLRTAEKALRHLADLGGLTVEEKMLDLLAFSASESHVALRKKLGRAIDIAAGDKRSDEPRARTLVEMRFAASLRPCATCGAPPPENLVLHGSDDSWSLVGKCLYCGADRRFDFFTEGDPLKGEYARRELGDARASQVIGEHEFFAELERLSPLVAKEPRQLGPAEWRTSTRAVDRAITCVLELLKLGPESATRDSLTAERDRLLAIHARLRAEIPRIWELEGRRVGLGDEIRGLLNQVSKQRLPAAADLRDYFASRKVRSLRTAGPDLVRPPWATKVNGADDVFVELNSDCVTGVHIWDDSDGFGAYAKLFVREGKLDDVKDAMLHVGSGRPPSMYRVAGLPGVTAYLVVEDCGVRLSVEHEEDGSVVKVVTVHFPRVEQAPATTAVPPEILPALLDPAGPPLTVGALESALGMQLGRVLLPASAMGRLSATNVSATYGWDRFHETPVATFEDLRARSLIEWSATFAQGNAATDAALRERFGPPRELPSGRGRVYGPWVLAPAAGDQACTLSWYTKLPDWAVPPVDATRRERALVELAAAVTTADDLAGVARALSLLPDSCGLVRDPASPTARVATYEFVPPIGANELVRILGWRDAVGQTFDMHMQTWVVRVVTGQGAYGPETAIPTIGFWSVTATLGGWPTGETWPQPAPTGFGPPPNQPGGTHRFGPADVVRFIRFGG